MRRLIAAFKVSLDLKYQGPGNYADWADGWSDDYGLTPTIDACILGGGTYPGYEGYWSAMMAHPTEPSPMTGQVATAKELEWARVIPTLPHYVLSRSDFAPKWSNAKVIGSADAVADMKAQTGRDIYLMGGGRVFQTLLDKLLVDEVRLIVHPVLAGGSNDLFTEKMDRRSGTLVEARELGAGKVGLTYRLSL
jgi:dihydrofolate reductase